jgi:glucose dehydrogenase
MTWTTPAIDPARSLVVFGKGPGRSWATRWRQPATCLFGEADRYLNALNAHMGEKLCHDNLRIGVNAPPVTYEVNGVHYIAVAAGGKFQMNYPLGDAIAIFKLGK